MTIREMSEKLEAIEKEYGNVEVVNGHNSHRYEEGEKIYIDFHEKGQVYWTSSFGQEYRYTRTEVEIN